MYKQSKVVYLMIHNFGRREEYHEHHNIISLFHKKKVKQQLRLSFFLYKIGTHIPKRIDLNKNQVEKNYTRNLNLKKVFGSDIKKKITLNTHVRAMRINAFKHHSNGIHFSIINKEISISLWNMA